MSSQSITSGYPIFFGVKGAALDDGYVYVGTYGMDPETNPIVIYWDEALTVPAAQPLRTNEGFAVRAGTPATAFVGVGYSIRVKDKHGSTIYTNLLVPEPVANAIYADFANTASATKGDYLVGVKSALAGGTARNQHDKNADYVTAKDFGLFGGVVTDLVAIQNAIAAVATGGTVVIPDGDVNLGTGLVITKPVTLMLGAGDYTASANPVISAGAVKSIQIIGKSANSAAATTTIVAASAAGWAISLAGNTGYDYSDISNLTVTGNANADGGIYLQGQAKGWMTLNNLWVDKFTKSSGSALGLYGCITLQITNCSFADSYYGAILNKTGSTTSNLNTFKGCNFVGNVQNIYITGACHANVFEGCNIAQATSAPSVYVEYGQGNTFRECYFEANAAGTCVVQVGHSAGTFYGQRTRVISCYIAEVNAITSFMHVYAGYQSGCFMCHKESSAAITNLVYYDNPGGVFGYTAFNGGNYPTTDIAGPRSATCLGFGFDNTGVDIYKNTSGIGRLEFATPFTPRQCTVAQLGTGGIAPNAVGTMVYVTNGRKPGEGAGAGTGVLAVYTNSAYRDIGAGTYPVVVA